MTPGGGPARRGGARAPPLPLHIPYSHVARRGGGGCLPGLGPPPRVLPGAVLGGVWPVPSPTRAAPLRPLFSALSAPHGARVGGSPFRKPASGAPTASELFQCPPPAPQSAPLDWPDPASTLPSHSPFCFHSDGNPPTAVRLQPRAALAHCLAPPGVQGGPQLS